MATSTFGDQNVKWQDFLDANYEAIMATNPTDALLIHLKSKRFITQDEYKSINEIAAERAMKRSNKFLDMLSRQSDRFSAPDKLVILIKAFSDQRNYPRPTLAKVFQKYLDDNYPVYEAAAAAGVNKAEPTGSGAPQQITIRDARIGVLTLGGSASFTGGVTTDQSVNTHTYNSAK